MHARMKDIPSLDSLGENNRQLGIILVDLAGPHRAMFVMRSEEMFLIASSLESSHTLYWFGVVGFCSHHDFGIPELCNVVSRCKSNNKPSPKSPYMIIDRWQISIPKPSQNLSIGCWHLAFGLMLVWQCHKPSPSHHHFCGWYKRFQPSI